MRKKTIALHLRRFTYSGLAVFAQTIHDGLAASSIYTLPPVSLTDQQNAINALRDAIKDWGTVGNRGSTLSLAIARDNFDRVGEDLRKLARYCMTVTPNDEASWLAAGFVTARPRQKGTTLEPVREFHQFIARNIPNLFIKLIWKRPLSALPRETIIYKVFRSDDADIANAEELTTVMKTVFIDKPEKAGILYYYWIVPVNTSGNGVMSEICAAAAMPQG